MIHKKFLYIMVYKGVNLLQYILIKLDYFNDTEIDIHFSCVIQHSLCRMISAWHLSVFCMTHKRIALHYGLWWKISCSIILKCYTFSNIIKLICIVEVHYKMEHGMYSINLFIFSDREKFGTVHNQELLEVHFSDAIACVISFLTELNLSHMVELNFSKSCNKFIDYVHDSSKRYLIGCWR